VFFFILNIMFIIISTLKDGQLLLIKEAAQRNFPCRPWPGALFTGLS
jgi:hypothetical protein